MKIKVLSVFLVLACLIGNAVAKEVTNRGETFTTTTLSDDPSGDRTVTKSQSVYPQAGTDRRGLYVFSYTVPAAGITGEVSIGDEYIPKGVVLLEDAFIEVSSAVLPLTTATNVIAVGGVTVLSSTNMTAGIQAAVTAPGITTSRALPTITVSGTATAGVFTVYLPVIMGNAL